MMRSPCVARRLSKQHFCTTRCRLQYPCKTFEVEQYDFVCAVRPCMCLAMHDVCSSCSVNLFELAAARECCVVYVSLVSIQHDKGFSMNCKVCQHRLHSCILSSGLVYGGDLVLRSVFCSHSNVTCCLLGNDDEQKKAPAPGDPDFRWHASIPERATLDYIK